MALNLYRRHGTRCTRGHALQTKTYEADELRRRVKSCECPIDASGTLGRHFNRKNTEYKTWLEAKAVVRAWEDADSWNGRAEVEPPVAPALATADRCIKIERALQAFTVDYQDHVAPNTQKMTA